MTAFSFPSPQQPPDSKRTITIRYGFGESRVHLYDCAENTVCEGPLELEQLEPEPTTTQKLFRLILASVERAGSVGKLASLATVASRGVLRDGLITIPTGGGALELGPLIEDLPQSEYFFAITPLSPLGEQEGAPLGVQVVWGKDAKGRVDVPAARQGLYSIGRLEKKPWGYTPVGDSVWAAAIPADAFSESRAQFEEVRRLTSELGQPDAPVVESTFLRAFLMSLAAGEAP